MSEASARPGQPPDRRRREALCLAALLALPGWVRAGIPLASDTAGSLPVPAADPDVGQLVECNVAARGGLAAWRQIRAMAWRGRMEADGSDLTGLPFWWLQARPNRSRFEIDTQGQRSVRVFDGEHGWKLHPARGIRPAVAPFSTLEARFAQEAEVIDGPLIDHAAHGSRVTLAGRDDVQGRAAWRIDVTRSSGARESVWLDAQTFLDLRHERTSVRASGGTVAVVLHFHAYRQQGDVLMPGVLEIGGAAGLPAGRMHVDQVILNPPIDDQAFARPGSLTWPAPPPASAPAQSAAAFAPATLVPQ